MTISELANNYCFHDSTIEKISCDRKRNEVTLYITFCVWAQNWYDEEKDDEVETLILTFKNVSKTDCSDYEAGAYDQIIDCDLIEDKEHGKGIKFVNVTESDCFLVTIFAEKVVIERVENKTWNQSQI